MSAGVKGLRGLLHDEPACFAHDQGWPLVVGTAVSFKCQSLRLSGVFFHER